MCFFEMAEKHMKALELQFIKETTDLFIDKKLRTGAVWI